MFFDWRTTTIQSEYDKFSLALLTKLPHFVNNLQLEAEFKCSQLSDTKKLHSMILSPH